MFVHFFPPQNVLKQFPVNGRAVACDPKRPGDRRLAERLAAHFGATIVDLPDHPDGDDCAVVIATTEQAAPELATRLPANVERFDATSFVALLPDTQHPLLWIGGKGNDALNDTVSFLDDILDDLLVDYLLAGDFHMHTTVSDGLTDPADLPAWIDKARLDAFAVTDHNSTASVDEVRRATRPGIPVLKGQELTDSKKNHVVVLGERADIGTRDPDEVVARWRNRDVVIFQAHATEADYFRVLDGRGIGAEAFNFLSSAPQAGRDFLDSCLKAGQKVAALGCSDAHLSADVGKARTYLKAAAMTPEAILESLAEGACVAYYRGLFFGEYRLRRILEQIYRHSNLLDGKLVPLDDAIYYTPATPAIPAPALPDPQALTTAPPPSAPRIFCGRENCQCGEEWFPLPEAPTDAVLVGQRQELLAQINGITRHITLHTGLDLDLTPLLRAGANEMIFSELPQPDCVRLCVGNELMEWQIREDSSRPFRPITRASNLQILGLAPKNFYGSFEYRALFNHPGSGPGLPTLFFDGIDGDIDIILDGQTLLTRGMLHWEDALEVPIPPEISEGQLELRIVLRNEVGLCGVTNRAYAGWSIPLTGKRNQFNLVGGEDLLVLRAGETRARGFLCDRDYKLVDSFLANGAPYPIKRQAAWLVVNSFQGRTHAQLHHPR